ncbi:hypothetical protein TSAR_010949 [Trichomalopsis sarcophagae]|uniref:SMP-30/Gluconolactonase/LRE-like region domain-containing protein n=1 Tax=Trichomalopsis sarcophagae TaxID=543379 RepID=A0A232FE46_9HYME|nr:hypothetical protein TSAR_010949 [Trichomalopsis sarcophagae]
MSTRFKCYTKVLVITDFALTEQTSCRLLWIPSETFFDELTYTQVELSKTFCDVWRLEDHSKRQNIHGRRLLELVDAHIVCVVIALASPEPQPDPTNSYLASFVIFNRTIAIIDSVAQLRMNSSVGSIGSGFDSHHILAKVRELDSEQERESIWWKIRDRLDSTDNVVSNASNIHKSVKSDQSAIKSQVKRLERGQVALKKSRESFGLMLSEAKMLPNQQHIQKDDKDLQTINASNAVTTRTLNKRKAMPPSQVLNIDPKERRILKIVQIPASRVTSLTFGGRLLDTLFVTTASLNTKQGNSMEPYAGRVFSVQGLASAPFVK